MAPDLPVTVDPATDPYRPARITNQPPRRSMATAVEHGSEPRTPPSPPLSLPVSSLLGAAYVVAAIAVIAYGVPAVWNMVLGSQPVINEFSTAFLRSAIRVVLAVALLLAPILFGPVAQKGIRGGIFLILAAAVIIFFIWRWVALNVSGTPGMVVSLAVAITLAVLAIRFLGGARGAGWMIAIEEQGWFHASAYKRILGQRVRRLTILGIVLIGGSGCYSLWAGGTLPETWTLAMPFDMEPLHVLTSANMVIPWVVVLFTLWVAYRAVNVPAFAEFLIATEAEMNKVSWTPRKRLGQDTIVVLATTLLLAVFLLVVDIFWSWGIRQIGVLPSTAAPEKGGAEVQQARW